MEGQSARARAVVDGYTAGDHVRALEQHIGTGLIGYGIFSHGGELHLLLGDTVQDTQRAVSDFGVWGVVFIFLRAFSLGGGTYTGIEAVSNGLSIMREPRVETGKRTMLYMGVSLAATAAGLLLCYLLWSVQWTPGKTMNAVLAERFAGSIPLGGIFVVLLLLSEGAILVVAAQAGFVDGPRVLANMAVDSWVPRRFAALSERLTTQNGILLMGAAGLGALLYTGGEVQHIVVLYSINVFLTFSMTMLAMVRLWLGRRKERADWKRPAPRLRRNPTHGGARDSRARRGPLPPPCRSRRRCCSSRRRRRASARPGRR